MKSQIDHRKSKMEKTGTREWSDTTVNCQVGCSHGCLYCYAAEMAARYKRRPRLEWTREETRMIRPEKLPIAQRVMFPSTHDLTPANARRCFDVVEMLLERQNRVLVVSKAHGCVIDELVRFRRQRNWSIDMIERLEIRVTMGAVSPQVLAFWEPGAPMLTERMYALMTARECNFATSVSMEPLLEPERLDELWTMVEPFVGGPFHGWQDGGGEIWIGKANLLHLRTAWVRSVPVDDRDGLGLPDDVALDAEIARIDLGQTDAAVRDIYRRYKDQPKARWKDSYRKVLGLDGAKP